MPAYFPFVEAMTVPDQVHHRIGLDSLASVVGHLDWTERELVAEEPGLLAAVEPFLRSVGEAGTALDLLVELEEGGQVFRSPCFPTVVDIAATGGTVELKEKAWAVILEVARGEYSEEEAMFDSPGMAALLQGGLESEDDDIAEKAHRTVSWLVVDEGTVASKMLDSHPDLVEALIKNFGKDGACEKFLSKSHLFHSSILSSFSC